MKTANRFFCFVLIFFSWHCGNWKPESEISPPVKIEKSFDYSTELKLSKQELSDKIKGAWAGQLIGCTYGGPTEFRFCGTIIQDYIPIVWDHTRMEWYYKNQPGLYDDIYMDLTFVDVIEKQGINAPAKAHATAFANAGYKLWHANQAARYNILHGIAPPASGHWMNNPHADDIDFQIEADFAGIMSPAMVNAATSVCDTVGHIMNYGDGWYGGVFVAAMYSLAFVINDVEILIKEALKTIPEKSTFHQCISDVIKWYHQYPDDWRDTWFACEKKWSSDIGCPDGVFKPFNIDAKMNAAYIAIGMLYGQGDFGKTLEISTRCGQDSDCNPASAAGILGTVTGYDSIPAYWKQGIEKVEELNFSYTDISLQDAYRLSMKHALQQIKINGGRINGDKLFIPIQKPETVRYEQCFDGHFPVARTRIDKTSRILSPENTKAKIQFSGNGFVITGRAWWDKCSDAEGDHNHKLIVTIDDTMVDSIEMNTNYGIRRFDVYWRYGLQNKPHKVELELSNPKKGFHIELNELIVYSNTR